MRGTFRHSIFMKAHTEASVDSMSLVPQRFVSRLPQLNSRVSLIVVPFGLNGCSSFSPYSFPQPTEKQVETDRGIMMKKKCLILVRDSKILTNREFYFNIQDWLYHPRYNDSREEISPEARRAQTLVQAQGLLFQQVDIQFSTTKPTYESVLRARTMAAYYIGAGDIGRFTMSIIIVS
jgi:hypothetical protein